MSQIEQKDRNDSKSVVEEICRKHKLIGRGYKEIDPEVQKAVDGINDALVFLNTRCAWTTSLAPLRDELISIRDELELFQKQSSKYYPEGLFERGFEYAFQEIQSKIGGKKN